MQVAQFKPSSYALVPLHMDRPIETVIPTPEHRISRICFHPLFRPLIAQTLSYMGGLMIGVQTAQLRRLSSRAGNRADHRRDPFAYFRTGRIMAQKHRTHARPGSPGKLRDLAARLFAERFAERWGKPVIVENRPGADGILAVQALLHANDGHTLLFAFPGIVTVVPLLHDDIRTIQSVISSPLPRPRTIS